MARDISAPKRAERQSAAFALLGHRLSGATTPAQAVDIILDIASVLFGWDAGYVHRYLPAEDKIIPVLTVDILNGQRTPLPLCPFKVTRRTPIPSGICNSSKPCPRMSASG